MEKGQCLQQMVLGKLDCNMQKNEAGPLSYTMHKTKFKMDERHNVRQKTIKIVEDTQEVTNLFDLGRNNSLLDMSPRAGETKANMNYWDFKENNQQN